MPQQYIFMAKMLTSKELRAEFAAKEAQRAQDVNDKENGKGVRQEKADQKQ